jgi:hypothetical protein
LIDGELQKVFGRRGDCRIIQADPAGSFHPHPPSNKLWRVYGAGKSDSRVRTAFLAVFFKLHRVVTVENYFESAFHIRKLITTKNVSNFQMSFTFEMMDVILRVRLRHK